VGPERGSTEKLTRLALELVPYIFPRPIEFRHMEWSQIRLHGVSPEWRVSWPRMKMREPHIVPLSRQAVAILREIHQLTGRVLRLLTSTDKASASVKPWRRVPRMTQHAPGYHITEPSRRGDKHRCR
jgi:integrase